MRVWQAKKLVGYSLNTLAQTRSSTRASMDQTRGEKKRTIVVIMRMAVMMKWSIMMKLIHLRQLMQQLQI